MAKFSLCIFTVAVLLGAGATSDTSCLSNEFDPVAPYAFFTRPTSACLNVELRFNQVRSGLKKCTRNKVDISLLETLHNDFCTLDSDYRQKFNRQQRCLFDNMRNVASCLTSITDPTPDAIRGRSINELCTNVSMDSTDCFDDKVGRPCGDEGLEVYGRITEASKPFVKGLCLVALRSALGESENAMTEDTTVGVVEVESISTDVACRAAPNFALLWCILLGLLITVKWWW